MFKIQTISTVHKCTFITKFSLKLIFHDHWPYSKQSTKIFDISITVQWIHIDEITKQRRFSSVSYQLITIIRIYLINKLQLNRNTILSLFLNNKNKNAKLSTDARTNDRHPIVLVKWRKSRLLYRYFTSLKLPVFYILIFRAYFGNKNMMIILFIFIYKYQFFYFLWFIQ